MYAGVFFQDYKRLPTDYPSIGSAPGEQQHKRMQRRLCHSYNLQITTKKLKPKKNVPLDKVLRANYSTRASRNSGRGVLERGAVRQPDNQLETARKISQFTVKLGPCARGCAVTWPLFCFLARFGSNKPHCFLIHADWPPIGWHYDTSRTSRTLFVP